MRKKLTAKYVCSLLSYNMDNGLFIWKERPGKNQWNSAHSGRVAGSNSCRDKIESGYTVITIDGCPYQAHRLAWLLKYGEWPTKDIDHKDRDGTNSRIENLRLATRSENRSNQKKPKNNTSGFKGVTWHKSARKWQAAIVTDGKFKYLGIYDSAEDAHAEYCREAIRRRGEFARFA